ncbi:MAG: rRNA adenine N-6-methyltransferase family protein, partial [Anaerolineaceae bacterium]
MNHPVPESNSLELPVLDVSQLLRQAGLRPDKRLGQNFLIDPVALQRVVESAELEKNDLVLEVGAGLGSLTRYLAVS